MPLLSVFIQVAALTYVCIRSALLALSPSGFTLTPCPLRSIVCAGALADVVFNCLTFGFNMGQPARSTLAGANMISLAPTLAALSYFEVARLIGGFSTKPVPVVFVSVTHILTIDGTNVLHNVLRSKYFTG